MAITEAIIDYIVQHYGTGGSLNSDGSTYDNFTDHLMLEDFGTEIMPRPFPSGVTLNNLMQQDVVAMIRLNPGATKSYLYTHYANGGTPTPPPPGAKDAWVKVCTHVAGATLYIDDVAQTEKTKICHTWTKYPVQSGKILKLELELLPAYPKDRNRCTTKRCQAPIAAGGELEWTRILEGITGTKTGKIIIKAHDADTNQSLAAIPKVNGTTAEEGRLCPIEMILAAPKEYELSVSYPGYEETVEEVVYLNVNETITRDFGMTPVEIWREVEVREKGIKEGWITNFKIPPTLVWNVEAKGSITFHFEEQGKYDAYFDLHPEPADWGPNYDLKNLPASRKTVHATITPDEGDEIIPWFHDKSYKANWAFTPTSALPAGRYIAVARLAIWD